MMADSGWVETIRDKKYAGAKAAANNQKSEFMSKSELSKDFRQMNIADSGSAASSGSDLMVGAVSGEKVANFKLQQNVCIFLCLFRTVVFIIRLSCLFLF